MSFNSSETKDTPSKSAQLTEAETDILEHVMRELQEEGLLKKAKHGAGVPNVNLILERCSELDSSFSDYLVAGNRTKSPKYPAIYGFCVKYLRWIKKSQQDPFGYTR